jgi:ubiquinone/menaquinone biosynthesis C-methylase UbiE
MSRDSYRRVARWYDRLFESLNVDLWSIGMTMLSLQEGMSVLDVGCGTGVQLDLYQRAGCKAFGIDTSPAMLEVARQRLGERADLYPGDASDMPYPARTFDLIVCTMTLHAMPGAIRSTVINEAKRALKIDGRILLADFHPGPIQLPMGWFTKSIILGFEMAGGREHFKNYRDFMSHGGLPTLIAAHGLVVEEERIVKGGNMGLFLLRLE